MQFSMSESEQQAFLAEPRVGIFSFNQGGDSPLMTPMWYFYEAGDEEYWFQTDAESRKGKLIFEGSPISLLVQKDSMPHKYVWVRGQVSTVSEGTEEEWQRMAARYGAGGQAGAAQALPADPITVRVRIKRWTSYTEEGA